MVRCSKGATGHAGEGLDCVRMALICIGRTMVEDRGPGQGAGWQSALLLIGCVPREVNCVAHSPTGVGGKTGIRARAIDDSRWRGIVHADGHGAGIRSIVLVCDSQTGCISPWCVVRKAGGCRRGIAEGAISIKIPGISCDGIPGIWVVGSRAAKAHC